MPSWRLGRRRTVVIALTGVVVVLVLAIALIPRLFVSVQAPTPAGPAADGPGATSYNDLGRKDCLGTADTRASKVWFTVAGGVLSDVYFPTIDNTNVKSLRFIVTDGKTFTDLQGRDTTYTVGNPDGQALDCQVVTTAKSGKYRLTTDYIADPGNNAILMRVRLTALRGSIANYKLYVRFHPLLNGNGGGGPTNVGGDTGIIDGSTGHQVPVAYDTHTQSLATNRTYATPVYSALDATSPLSAITNGFAGMPSDGLAQIAAHHQVTRLYATAANGDLTQTAAIAPGASGQFTLALGFGETQTGAVTATTSALAVDFAALQQQYNAGWHTYDSTLRAPPPTFAGVAASEWQTLVNQYYYSANVLKASEDKTFPGAIVASLAAPWGQSVPANDQADSFFGSYREVFARDLYEAWTGFYTDGDLQTARDAVLFLFDAQQQPGGPMPRNSLLNGMAAPDTGGEQLDETSYPILMADQMGMTDAALYQQHIKPAADFLVRNGPASGVERWEEQNGYSPSTIAAEIAGLVAAADIARINGDTASAQTYLATADAFQRGVKGWTVTTTGPLAAHPYFIRLSKTGDPNLLYAYDLGNGGLTQDQRAVVDAGFLELVRLGEFPANDPDITQSLPVIDQHLEIMTPSGPGWLRYNGDGYGDSAVTGAPWAPTGTGTGHVWPALTAERGEYDLAAGDPATAIALLMTMKNFASGVGLIPEQDWDSPNLAASPFNTNPMVASIGFQDGQPAGSAAPLTWAMGAYVRLMADTFSGKLLEQPANVYDRYVAGGQG